ncbi:MAG TPA: DUF5615 family PIN-like protein [Terriglobia bacterium]|nr:DUF5615 family PIN-like protein [Terriglobia bacterium]
MLLLDQGLPRSTVEHLRAAGIEAVHAGDIGQSTAEDAAILEYARERDWVIVTLDADFHTRLALSSATKPSVIRVRIEGLRGPELAELLDKVLTATSGDLAQGAMVTVAESGVRVHRLPILG